MGLIPRVDEWSDRKAEAKGVGKVQLVIHWEKRRYACG